MLPHHDDRKIHRAKVTQADLHYVGSVHRPDLLDAAGLLEGEQVTIVDIDNGARLKPMRSPASRLRCHQDQRRCSTSGAPRRPGDHHRLRHPSTSREIAEYSPNVVFVDEHNRILLRATRPRPEGSGLLDPASSSPT